MQLDQCPVCKSNNITFLFIAKDHLVSHKEFKIYGCNQCTLRFTNPRPETKELSRYYESDEYISHTDQSSSLINSLYKIARKFTIKRKRRLLQGMTNNYTLLDFGCGTGHFIEHCKGSGWQVSGVEPNELARSLAAGNTMETIYDDLSKVGAKSFDIITLWHVLEHVAELNKTIEQLKALLAVDGTLVIAVPNYEAYETTIYKEFWAAYDVPRHLYHFNRKSMKALLAQHGLKIVKTYPMLLDSFYISLLSNKNQFGDSKYIKSFITGLLSNVYAINTGKYSSLIYQVEKE